MFHFTDSRLELATLPPKLNAMIRQSIVVLVSIAALGASAQQTNEHEDQAKAAVTEWLALVDAGRYGDSWKRAGSYMQRAFPKEKWERNLETIRKPLGEVSARKLKSAKFVRSDQPQPLGDYFTMQFTTSFSNKQEAVETVTPMLQQDGTWKVSGYFIE